MAQGRQVVFDAITGNQTVELHTFSGLEPTSAAGSILIEIHGSNQSDFEVNIQGKLTEDDTYANIDYVEIFTEGKGVITKDEIFSRDVVHRYYMLPYPPPLVQLEAIAKRGMLTVYVSFVTNPFDIPVSDRRIIELLELILQGINSNLLNQIGTAEILQGIGTQLATITGLELIREEH